MTDLHPLRSLLSEATPGEWRVETQTLDNLDYDTDEPQVYIVHPGTVCTDTVVATMGETCALTTAQKQANAALIVALRNNAEALLAVAAEAQFLCDRLDSLEWSDDGYAEVQRGYFGHVEPSHARLKALLSTASSEASS